MYNIITNIYRKYLKSFMVLNLYVIAMQILFGSPMVDATFQQNDCEFWYKCFSNTFFKDLNRLILRIGIVYKFERHLCFFVENSKRRVQDSLPISIF